jgi:CheY-like chemotaxis protein
MSRILVIEDDQDFCEALSRYLRATGYHVDCQHDGHLGLRDLLENHPDLVLLDIRMPVMDGLSFLSIVRSYVRLRNIPIVVMTGSDDPTVLTAVEGYGVTQVLKKGSFDFSDIRRALDKQITLIPGGDSDFGLPGTTERKPAN